MPLRIDLTENLSLHVTVVKYIFDLITYYILQK